MSSDRTSRPEHRGGRNRDGRGHHGKNGGGGGGGSGRRRGGRRSGKRKDPGDAPPVSPETLASIQPNLGEGEYIVFDIETTGGNPEKNGITEIFAIRFKDGQIVDTFGTLVNPLIPIPPIVRRMTGINNAMVRGAPKIEEVMPQFLEFARKGVLVSHNTIGDMKFVRYFAKTACDVNFENFFLCTHLLVERLAPEAPDKSLKGLAEHFDLPRGELHRAEADAYVTLELFKVLLGRLKDRSVRRIEEAVRLQGDMESGLRLGWGVSTDSVRDAPDTAGVYRLYDHERRLLFLSSATHLAREMAKLRSLDQLPRPMLRLVLRSYNIDWETAPNVFASLLLECDALEKHPVTFAPVDWHQRTMQSVFVVDDDEGLRVGIGPLEQGTRFAFGPVRDRRIAGEFLDVAAEVLGAKMGRRGMVFPRETESLLLGFLKGELAELHKETSRRSRALKLWFKPRERKELKEASDKLARLLKVPVPQRMGSMLDRVGAVVVPDAQAGSWQVHRVAGSRPFGMTTFKGDPELRLKTTDLGAELAQAIERDAARVTSAPLSAADATRVNATLWWIYNGRFEGRFVPLADLKGAPAGA